MNTIQKEASELHTMFMRTYPDKILLVPDPLMNMVFTYIFIIETNKKKYQHYQHLEESKYTISNFMNGY